MTEERSMILDSDQVREKIRRMAFEIYENNFNEKAMVLAGIEGQGYSLAGMLAKELSSVSPLEVQIVKVSLDKSSPEKSEISLDCDLGELKKKCIVLIDDVLNTGRTMAYSLKPFLSTEVKKIEVAVLVNRGHSLFPIWPKYTGYELSTTLNDHVEVLLGKKQAVFLK